MKFVIVIFFFVIVSIFSFNGKEIESYSPASHKNNEIKEWESLRFGAFVHFNDNTFLVREFSKNTDPKIFNPTNLDFESMMKTLKAAGVKYAVLTTRHTSGFCLWDSKVTSFDVANSPFKKDVVKLFVNACRKYNIKPCLYYCLWGSKDWDPSKWNPIIKSELEKSSAKRIILAQLSELATNYGNIYEFWLDMQCWADTSLKPQESYDLVKSINPRTFVHFNEHVQDGSKLRYFPTDFINGEERTPPVEGHNPNRTINGQQYYLPFEYEITSQRCDSLTLGNGLMKGSVWFTFPMSKFYPVDSLYHFIKQNFDRGGANILLSTAPDKSGTYRKSDSDSIIKLGKLIWKNIK